MSSFPRPPLFSRDHLSREWTRWYNELQQFIGSVDGLIPWGSVSKAGANLTDLTTRAHNDLQTVQGGAAGERYHLTAAELAATQVAIAEAGRAASVDVVAADTALTDDMRTVVVTASGKTVTLPAASAARVGKDWTVILGTVGYVTVARAGSDTLTLPVTATTIRIRTKGASLTMRCLTATSWGIA